jgi:glycosyltransferase involved in cell wall biosynthesis
VSVGAIVAVHGWAPYLAEALDSVLAEGPGTVMVVDDGSPEPVKLHPDHAGRCWLVRRDERGGPAAARATGLAELGEADLVALCDADDAWEPGRLAPQVEALLIEPGAALAFGRALVVGPDGQPTGERWPEPAAGPIDPVALYEANPIPTSSVLLRRSSLDAAGGFAGPVEVAEDWELWLRLARAGGVLLCVPEATVRYRRHPGALTADVEALAHAQQTVHELHADLVGPEVRGRAAALDRAAIAAGPVRRALRAVAGGRRDPYRR